MNFLQARRIQPIKMCPVIYQGCCRRVSEFHLGNSSGKVFAASQTLNAVIHTTHTKTRSQTQHEPTEFCKQIVQKDCVQILSNQAIFSIATLERAQLGVKNRLTQLMLFLATVYRCKKPTKQCTQLFWSINIFDVNMICASIILYVTSHSNIVCF